MSSDLQMALLKLLRSISEMDMNYQWANVNEKTYQKCSHDDDRMDHTEEIIPMIVVLTKFTRNPSNKVRESAVDELVYLMKRHDFRYPQMFESLSQSIENWKYVSKPDELFISNDKKANLISSSLKIFMAMKYMIPSSKLPVMKSVTRLFVREQVTPRIKQNALKLLHKDPKETLSPIIDHLVHDYLLQRDDLKLDAFPYDLMSSSVEIFVKDHEASVVPLLLWCGKPKDMIKYVANLLKKKESQIIVNNFVSLASIYVPQIYNNDARNSKAKDLSENVIAILGEEKQLELLNEHFSSIIAFILLRINDPKHFQETFEKEMTEKPELIYPGTSVKKFHNMLTFFKNIQESEAENGLFSKILSCHADGLQNIFTVLCKPLKSISSSPLSKSLACHSIIIMLDILESELEDTNSPLLKKHLPYVTWYIVQCCLKIGKNKDLQEMLMKVVMKLLKMHSILDDNWESDDKTMSKLLRPITSWLIETCVKNEGSKLFELSFQCLHFAIITNKGKFPRSLRKFRGQFPQDKEYFNVFLDQLSSAGELDDSMEVESKELQMEMNNFLDSQDCRLELLLRLRNKLLSSRLEICDILDDAHGTKMFSEDIKKSPLLKTIKRLINMSRDDNSVADEMKLVANECLGIIGPLDLNTMTIGQEEDDNDAQSGLVVNLLDAVFDEDYEISAAAIHGLKRVLATMKLNFQLQGFQVSLLRPFINVFTQASGEASSSLTLESEQLNSAVANITFWPNDHVCHEDWIRDFVCKLLVAYPEVKEGHLKKSSKIGRHLVPLVKKQPSFCSKIFPWVIHDILKNSNVDRISLCNGIKHFFLQHYNSSQTVDVKCVKTMLQLVKFLRKQSRNLQTPWQDNFWIPELNYLHVANSAFKCQDYIGCLAFCDIWSQTAVSNDKIEIDHLSTSVIDGVHDHYVSIDAKDKVKDVKKCQTLMADSFFALGEKDAIDGCTASLLSNFSAQTQHLMYKKEFTKAMIMFDAKLCQNTGDLHQDRQSLLMAMKEASFENTLEMYQKGCAESLSTWSDELANLVPDKANRELYLNKIHTQSLKISNDLLKGNVVSVSDIYRSLADLRTLVDFETFAKCMDNDENAVRFLPCEFQQYEYAKSIVSQRLKILATVPKIDLVGQGGQRSPVKEKMIKAKQIKTSSFKLCQELCVQICDLGRKNEDYHFVYKMISTLDSMKEGFGLDLNHYNEVSQRIMYQRSSLFWSWGEKDMAIKMMRGLMKELKKQKNKPFLAETLITMADWLWTSRSSNAQVILEEYYKKA